MMGLNELQFYASKLGNYMISDVDDASNPKYYGFADREGGWYILKEDTTDKTYRYCKGTSDYTTNWTNRASSTYDYPFNIFHV